MSDVELGVDFVFNEAEAKAAQERIKKGLVSVGDTAEAQAKRVENTGKRVSVLDAATIEHLRKIKEAKLAAYTTPTHNTTKAAEYNNVVSKTTTEINKVKEAGKTGFSDLGNSVAASATKTGGLSKVLGVVGSLIPGIGIASIASFAIGPIVKYISSLDVFKKKLDQIVETKKELSATNLKGAQDAQQEITSLKVLYDAAQNKLLSDEQRYTAAKKLQEQYPETFKNYSLEEIQLGKTDKAYLSLANSIIATARARASEGKITENSSLILANEEKMVELQAKRAAAVAKLEKDKAFNKAKPKTSNSLSGAMGDGGFSSELIQKKAIKAIEKEIYDKATSNEILNKRNLALGENIVKNQLKGAKIADLKDEPVKVAKAAKVVKKAAKDNGEKALREQEALQAKIDDVIAKREQEQADREQKRYDDAYNSALTSAQKIEKINEDYRQKARDLGIGITDDQKNELLRKRDEEVNAEKEIALSKTEIYKKLAETALVLTREQVAQQIEIMKGLLKDPSLDGAAKSGVESLLKGLESRFKLGAKKSNTDALSEQKNNIINAVNERVAQGITSPENKAYLDKLYKDLAAVEEEINIINKTGLDQFFESFKGLGAVGGTAKALDLLSDTALGFSQALGGVDTQAGYTLDTIGQLAGTAADLGASLVSGNPVKIIGSAIKAVGSLFSIGKKVKEMNAAARKEVADFYANAISGEREYQDLLRERQLKTIKDNKTALLGINAEMKLRKQQTSAWSKESAEIMAKLQGMQFVQDQSYKHGTWFRKAKVTKTMGSLSGKSFAELSQLLAQGKLEGDAKALVERLKELEQKGYDAEQAMADLAKQVAEIFTGTNADSLTKSLVDMFKSGKTGVQDLADFFKSAMDDAALSIFENKVLAGLMSTFYDDFAEKAQSDEELTSTEIEDLQKLFASLTDQAKSKFEDLKKITGSDLGASPTKENQNTIKGDFKNLSEETGGVLAGRLAGVQLAMVELVAIKKNEVASSLVEIKQQTQYQMEIAANTLVTANNTNRLENMETALVSIDKKMTSTNNSLRAAGG